MGCFCDRDLLYRGCNPKESTDGNLLAEFDDAATLSEYYCHGHLPGSGDPKTYVLPLLWQQGRCSGISDRIVDAAMFSGGRIRYASRHGTYGEEFCQDIPVLGRRKPKKTGSFDQKRAGIPFARLVFTVDPKGTNRIDAEEQSGFQADGNRADGGHSGLFPAAVSLESHRLSGICGADGKNCGLDAAPRVL